MKKIKLSELAGWLGLVCLQANSLPLTLNAIEHVAVSALTPTMTIAGLSLYMIRALSQRDILYMAGNSIGIILNSILLYYIVR